MIPAWLLSLILSLGLPALKGLLKMILKGLESKYPGLTPLVEAILRYLDSGGKAFDLQTHCEQLPDFCPAPLLHDK